MSTTAMLSSSVLYTIPARHILILARPYETYLAKEFLEMETLSPLYHIEPGETVRHVENLSLFHTPVQPDPEDEEQLEKFISELL